MRLPKTIKHLITLTLHVTLSCYCLQAFSEQGNLQNNPTTADFFNFNGLSYAKLNPEASAVALLERSGDNQTITIQKLPNGKKTTVLSASTFSGWEAGIGDFLWIDNNTVGVEFLEHRPGVKNLKNTSSVSHFLVISLDFNNLESTQIKSVRTSGKIILPRQPEKGNFLYAKPGRKSKVYRINANDLAPHEAILGKLDPIDGGQFIKSNEILALDGYVLTWFGSSDSLPESALVANSDGNLFLTKINGENQTTDIYTWPESGDTDFGGDKDFLPLKVAHTTDHYYCLDLNEANHRSVYLVDFANKSFELVYQEDSFDIDGLLVNEQNGKLYGVRVVRNGSIAFDYIDSNNDTHLDSGTRDSELQLVLNPSPDQNYALQYRVSHSQPGAYYLVDKLNNSHKLLGSTQNSFPTNHKSTLIEQTTTVDGLEIPFLLSLPKARQNTAFPLLVVPHGGPFYVHDERYFDPITQYFVASGFAVLRVNFRGSSGYSQSFVDSGKRQLGTGMLKDIRQATLEVLKRPDIKKDTTCILGMSYGGFAALSLILQDPNLYQCAVSIAGVTDLNVLVNTSTANKDRISFFEEYIGSDNDTLTSQSPIFSIESLSKPLLLIHGTDDKVVDIEHFYRAKLLLEKHDKQFEEWVVDGENHSFDSNESFSEVMDRSRRFLEQSLSAHGSNN